MATKTETRGLLIVHTGKGKGKSSAAFGMVLRAAKSNEGRTRAIGFSPYPYRLAAFVIAGAMCGLAGALCVGYGLAGLVIATAAGLGDWARYLGLVAVAGPGHQNLYYKGLLDKLGVPMENIGDSSGRANLDTLSGV